MEKHVLTLQNEFFAADTQFNIYTHLRKAVPDYDSAFRMSPQFWNFTFDAHINMVVLRLCKLYDTDEATMSLPRLLAIIEQNSQLFTEPAFRKRNDAHPNIEKLSKFPRTFKMGELQDDKNRCGEKNIRVKHLLVLRNNVIAHANYNVMLDNQKRLNEKFPLTGVDVESLIGDGLSIVNKYANLYGMNVLNGIKSSSYPANDFQILLDTMLNYVRETFPTHITPSEQS